MALGLVPLAAFGMWFYGFGVVLTPIVDDTGWRESSLAAAYGAGLLLSGFAGVAAGRVSERRGAPVVLIGAAVISLGCSWVIAATDSLLVFAVGAAVAAGVVGGAGYYSMVHSSIARLVPGDRRRAITMNTLFGAFASVVFLPLLAALTEAFGWRGAIRIGSVIVAVVFAGAALVLDDRGHPEHHDGGSFLDVLGSIVRVPDRRRLLTSGLVAGASLSVLFLYQVSAMTEAGLALGTASSLAGARGFLQLGGRLPIPWLGRVLGDRRTMRLALVLLGASLLVLPGSGSIAVALVFVVLAGLAVGAHSTIESVVAAEMVGASRVGTFLGVYALVRGISMFLGPSIAGLVTEAADSRTVALVGAAGLAFVASILVPRQPAAG